MTSGKPRNVTFFARSDIWTRVSPVSRPTHIPLQCSYYESSKNAKRSLLVLQLLVFRSCWLDNSLNVDIVTSVSDYAARLPISRWYCFRKNCYAEATLKSIFTNTKIYLNYKMQPTHVRYSHIFNKYNGRGFSSSRDATEESDRPLT